MVSVKARTHPLAATRVITAQICGSPAKSNTAMIIDTAAPARALKNKNHRLSSQSAITPDRIPKKNSGAMLAATATPTMNAEPVISKTN